MIIEKKIELHGKSDGKILFHGTKDHFGRRQIFYLHETGRGQYIGTENGRKFYILTSEVSIWYKVNFLLYVPSGKSKIVHPKKVLNQRDYYPP